MVELQIRPHRRAWTPEARCVAGFVALASIALLLIVLDQLDSLLPSGLATRIGHNSESLVLAIALGLTVAWLRSCRGRLPGTVSPPAVVAATLALFAAGLVLANLDGAPRVRTLNEPVFAAAILVPYCALWPRRRRFALTSVLVLVVTGVLFQTALVRTQAESIVALILAPIGLDLAARWMLSPDLRQSMTAAYLWTGALLLGPFAVMLLRHVDLGSSLNETVIYAARGNEAFWGLCLVHLLALVAWTPRSTSYGGRRGRPRAA